MVAGATPIYELWPFCFLLLLSKAFFLFEDQTPQYSPILLNTIKISPFQNKLYTGVGQIVFLHRPAFNSLCIFELFCCSHFEIRLLVQGNLKQLSCYHWIGPGVWHYNLGRLRFSIAQITSYIISDLITWAEQKFDNARSEYPSRLTLHDDQITVQMKRPLIQSDIHMRELIIVYYLLFGTVTSAVAQLDRYLLLFLHEFDRIVLSLQPSPGAYSRTVLYETSRRNCEL